MAKHYDPPMHSAEHILNQTMVRMFDCGRCVTSHIEPKKSRIDYRFPRELRPEEVAEIERRVNDVIRANLPVREEFLSRSEAQQQFSLKRLPDDAGDRIRIIRIGDYDSCPCIGPHVESTASIGTFRVVSTSYGEGLLRIRFRLER